MSTEPDQDITPALGAALAATQRTYGASNAPWIADLRRRVRDRLHAQGVTQADLAVRLGITEKHLSYVLTGRSSGSPDLLDELTAAVGLRIVIAGEDEVVRKDAA